MKKFNKIPYYSGLLLLTGVLIFPTLSNAQVGLDLNGDVNANAGQKSKATSTVRAEMNTNDKATSTKINTEVKNEIKAEERTDEDKGLKLGFFNSLWNSFSNRDKDSKDMVGVNVVIKNIQIKSDDVEAEIKWKTNVDAKAIFIYSTSTNFENTTTLELESSNKQSITLNDLTASTTYYYKITTTSENDVSVETGSFTTDKNQTEEPEESPILLWLRMNSVENDSATIAWITLEKTTNKVWVETDTNVDTSINASYIHNSLSFFHKVEIDGLQADTTYHFKVANTNKDGETTVSTLHSFTTKAE